MTTEALRSTSFIDIIPDMCFVVSDDLKILECNQKAREITGLPRSLDGAIPFHVLLTEDSPRPSIDEISVNGRMVEVEARFRKQWGKPIDAMLFISREERGGKELYYIVARDISETKERELDLLRFSNVVHYTVNPIQITDAQGQMIYVNPAFERATGYSKEELIGTNPRLISSLKYSKEFWGKVWNVISSGRVWTGEIENRRKDGQPLYTHLLISPIIDADGKVVGYLRAHRDITE